VNPGSAASADALGPRLREPFADLAAPPRHGGWAAEEQVHGFTVCRRTVAGLEYLFVSDLPSNQAGSIMTAAFGPESRG